MMRSSAAFLHRCLRQTDASAASLHLRPASRALSTSALTHDDNHHRHESEKMVSEGGGSKTSFHEKKEEVESKKTGVRDADQSSKDEWQETRNSVSHVMDKAKSGLNETKDSISENTDAVGDATKDKLNQAKGSDKSGEPQSVTGKVGEQAKKEMSTSADMVKDMPQKVAETTQGLKEVGVEAAKAVKRDVSHAAEKVGLKTSA